MVLVRHRRSRALWPASGLHLAGFRRRQRRPRRIRGEGQRGVDDPGLSGVAQVRRAMESDRVGIRPMAFRADENLRGWETLFFFLLFQKGGPLSAVPMILAGGAAIMVVVGISFFREPASWPRILGIAMVIGLLLMQKQILADGHQTKSAAASSSPRRQLLIHAGSGIWWLTSWV